MHQPTLFHVQLHERADAPQAIRVGAEVRRIDPGAPGGLGQRASAPVRERAGRIQIGGTGEQPRTQARQPEPAALLFGEAHHGERPGGRHAARPQLIDGQ